MFPVINVRGDVIAFSGRRLDAEKDYKYINSQDSIVFSKNRNIFGLNLAKKSKAGMLILVEGNIDVVMLHQAGFDCAVAPLGTALTAEQTRLLTQYTEKVVVVFDPDEAGRKATLRALSLLERTGKNIKVVNLGTSGDPDDFIRKHGADAFKILLERSESNIEYQLLTIQNTCNMDADEGRLKYISAASNILAEIRSEAEREIYIAKVAQTAEVSTAAIKNEVTVMIRANLKRDKKEFEKDNKRPRQRIQPASRELRYKNDLSAIAEEGIIRCLILDPELIKNIIDTGFSQEEFTSAFLSKVYEILDKRISGGREISQALIMSELETDEASQLTAILQKPESIAKGDRIIRDYITKIRAEKLKTQAPTEETLLEIKRKKEGKGDKK